MCVRLVLLCAFAVTVNCTCRPATLPGPTIEFVSQGSGEENAKPLWPLEVGYRSPSPGVVDGVAESPYGKGVLYRAGAPDGLDAQLYVKTDDGVYFAGSLDVGRLERPILLVPSRVKVGMKWVSHGSTRRPDTSAEVTSREMRTTSFGQARCGRSRPLIRAPRRSSNMPGSKASEKTRPPRSSLITLKRCRQSEGP